MNAEQLAKLFYEEYLAQRVAMNIRTEDRVFKLITPKGRAFIRTCEELLQKYDIKEKSP